MLDMLRQTGRPEMVVGWYHSHPGFGCWLSGVDINTQQSFEALSERAVAVVVDPIQVFCRFPDFEASQKIIVFFVKIVLLLIL